jgi:acyl-CoA reductase-like NAD-dependent aldehyde dehydrogenase
MATTTTGTGSTTGNGSTTGQPSSGGRPALTAATRRWLSGEHDLWIDGHPRSAHGGRMTTVDPATEEVLSEVACADAIDIDQAVAAARRATRDRRWATLAPTRKADAMLQVACVLEERAEDLAEIETLDVGKPRAQARADVAVAAGIFRYYSGWTTKLHGTVNPTGDDIVSVTVREPLGVCAAITPWNYPIVMAALKVAPAIACGNTVVLKPAEQTPLTALLLGEICSQADIPPGVVNVTPGYGVGAGAPLAAHADVDFVSFTGSTGVGQSIIKASADMLTPVMVELGGKSANIVFDDANIEAAVAGAMAGIWTNAGQWCVAGSRLLVQRSIHDKVVSRLVAATSRLRVGHGLDPTADVGPVISDAQRRRVAGYLDAGVREGASIAAGGAAVPGAGYFIAPTIFTGVDPSMRIAQEEIFGPVLAVIPFDDEEHAVAIANGTRYGLAAGIWSNDLGRVQRLARAVYAGMIWINTYGAFDYGTSYGGYKYSGFGRELGPYSLDAYTQSKSILTYVSPAPTRGRI